MHQAVTDYCLLQKARFPNSFRSVDVLDVGSLDINGNNRFLFEGDYKYTGIDLGEGKNVDIVCSAHEFNPGKQYDIIISTEMLEHNIYWRESLENMYKLLKDGGLLLVTCAGRGRQEHGTTRTSPLDAPFTNDYYMNLECLEFTQALNPDKNFYGYYEISKLGTDIRFCGIKLQK